jgi:uncharacterized membrane protein
VLATLALALVTTFWLGRLGQGGARRAPAASGGSPVGDGTVDAHWKLGLIYVNRDDPAVFVEKRFGIGYTLNFGNPQAWAVLAVMVVAATIALVLGWR